MAMLLRVSLIITALAAGIGIAQAAGTTLNVGMATADIGKLDPHLATSTPDAGLVNWMFNGLVRIKPGKASPEFIEPDLAESWTSSPDGLTWTFKLRQGVKCHGDYGDLTADDIVFSLKRAANKETSGFSADYKAFSAIEATSPSEVKITLSEPVPSLLGLLVPYHGGNIVCKKAVETLGAKFVQTPIGTGPFMFAEYQPQQFVKLVANPNYFRGAPKLKEILYRFIPSDSTRDLAYQSGEIDMIYGKQDQTWAERIKTVPNTKLAVLEPGEMGVLHLNMNQKPLDNPLVRRALAHAIDKKVLVKFKGEAVTKLSQSVVPEGHLGYTADVPSYPYDIAKAKALLAEAGYPNGVTIKVIQTTLPAMLSTMEALQAMVKKAGITLDVENVEHATFHAQIRKDLSPLVLYAAARFPVADTYLTQFFHSKSIVGTPTAITNFSHCDVADAEIDAARIEQDKAKQVKLWADAQKKIMEKVCAVPLYLSMQLWAWNDKLDFGFEPEGSLNLSPPVTELTAFK